MKICDAVVTLTVLCFLDSQAHSEPREVREVHYQMGTLLDITIWHSDVEEGKKILRRAVQEIHRLEEILSHYDPQSSLSLLNRQAGQGRAKIDPELFQLLAMATDFSIRTSGYFDVTVGPLVSLWQNAGEKGSLPEQAAIAQALDVVGYQKLKLYKNGEVKLVLKGMRIDLGGIGKGYAVDRIVSMMRKSGVDRALLNFGGSSIYALGSPPKENSWKINMRGTDEKFIGILHLKDQALSTSGSMGRYWKIAGKRYGHLINPKDGLPVMEPRMATVIAETATEAEALTKPMIILGKKGMSMIKDFPQTEALLTSENGVLWSSDRFVSKTFFQPIKNP